MKCNNWISPVRSALLSMLVIVAAATLCKDTDLLKDQDVMIPTTCTSLDFDSSLLSVHDLVNDLTKAEYVREINSINLCNNYLENDDVYILANYIVSGQSQALALLDVRGNNITSVGTNVFIEALATRYCLQLPEINILIDSVNLDSNIISAYMNTNMMNTTVGDVVIKRSNFSVKQDNRKGTIFAATDKLTRIVKWDNDVGDDTSVTRKLKENICFLRKFYPEKSDSSHFNIGNNMIYLQVLVSVVVVGIGILLYSRQKLGGKVVSSPKTNVTKQKKELTPKERNRNVILTTMSEASQKIALGKDEILPLLQEKCPSYAKKVLEMILAMDVPDIILASDQESVLDQVIEEAIRLIEEKNKKKKKCVIS